MRMPLILSILGLTLSTSCVILPIPASLEGVNLTPGDGAAVVPGQSTVVLAVGAYPPPDDLQACVQFSLAETAPDLPMLEVEKFRDALFPWFEPGVTPTREEVLAAILSRPDVRQRIDELRVRYLVLVADIQSFAGDIEGPWGPKIMIPAGVGWMKGRAEMVARIWDLRNASPVGTLAVTTSGEALVATWVVTVALVQMTTSKICTELGRQLALLLTGKQISAPEPVPARERSR